MPFPLRLLSGGFLTMKPGKKGMGLNVPEGHALPVQRDERHLTTTKRLANRKNGQAQIELNSPWEGACVCLANEVFDHAGAGLGGMLGARGETPTRDCNSFEKKVDLRTSRAQIRVQIGE
jgi:hypothetical protein